MGPQHPSTHGVLRLILEIEGETVTEARCGIGYLHTGIEKNLEYRNWTQGVTFVTRMDYLSPFFNETAYCLGVEKLLGITDADPRAGQRHPRDDDGAQPDLLAPGRAGHRRHGAGRDDARCSIGFRERELILDVFETDHRPADEPRLHPARRRSPQDLPAEARSTRSRELLKLMPQAAAATIDDLLNENPIWKARTAGRRLPRPDRLHGAGHHRPDPALHRAAARPAQGRSRTAATRPTTSTSSPTTAATAYGRYLIRRRGDARVAEDRRAVPGPAASPARSWSTDKKIAWPADLKLGPDGLGNSPEHIAQDHGRARWRP